MTHNTRERIEEKLAGKVVICDGLYTSKVGTILGTGSSQYSIKLLVDGLERYEPDYALLHVTEDNEQAIILLLSHHQELQKARQSWLREEIVKLEGMKRDLEQIEKECSEKSVLAGKRKRAISVAFGNNQALQTIIDRYLSELDQPIS